MIEEFHLQQAHVVTVPAVNYTDKQREEATELPEQPEGDEPSGSNYRRGGGQVMYIAHDRPDLQFAAKEVARAMAKPTSLDVTKLKRIARYLKQYPTMTLVLELEELPEALTVYVDSDWAGDGATRKSTSGGIVMLGDVVLTTWSRTQASVSLSSAEAEYYAITSGAVEAMYVQNLLKEMRRDLPIRVCTDSSAAKASAERHGVQRMKHMQIRLMFLKNLVKEGVIQMQKVKTDENPADMLTKALGQDKLQHCLQLLPGLARHEADMEIGLLMVEPPTCSSRAPPTCSSRVPPTCSCSVRRENQQPQQQHNQQQQGEDVELANNNSRTQPRPTRGAGVANYEKACHCDTGAV
ncbi:unnamed protein product [Polarella glacialis]|uniref:Reverse transcriptase Ty1/copia-type domain-containing protein n=1 Tax=Polarella glacialis TaxID=89957 RepID=A0A813D9U6_POLGL|nr:unnamed protein product [Polarella glacialis]